jgi:GntR family transcriptional regulator/MocR family aminotransferase
LGHYEVLYIRQAADIEIALTPRPDGMPLQRRLYGEIHTAILSGRLIPGSRLPATRDLALRLKISRGTVLVVYEQLCAEGYIRSATGRGSFIAPDLPDLRPVPAATENGETTPAGRHSTSSRHKAPAAVLSARGKKLALMPFSMEGRPLPARAFRPNQPDVAAFPFDLWKRIAASRSRRLRRNS